MNTSGLYHLIDGGVCAPEGFRASGIHSGIKRKRKDVALVVSDVPASAAGVFTTSKTVAACVVLDQVQLRKSGSASAIVVNSGNANACTGRRGMNDAKETLRTAARILGVPASEVLVSSTGVIGQYLPMSTLKRGIAAASNALTRHGGHDAAEAICTTDTFTKEVALELVLNGKSVRIGGMAKGSGMIAPNMATMLAFVTTDARISPSLLRTLIRNTSALTFNRISVDGDTSTNDMVIGLANGASGAPPLKAGSPSARRFEEALTEVLARLAKMIVVDGEGATKFVEIVVSGARNNRDAEAAARTIANSSLVKTAIHGEDANWGRILAAVGRAGIAFRPEETEIYFGNLRILGKNYDIAFSEARAKAILGKHDIRLTVNLNGGRGKATFWTCDLSARYVEINASYRS